MNQYTNPDRKFATNSVARQEAINFYKAVHNCSVEEAASVIDAKVSLCRKIAIAHGKVTNKVFLARDNNNGWDYYIDINYYSFTN